MQFSIPHATTPGLTATTTLEYREALNAGGLQATIFNNTNMTQFIQGINSMSYPQMRANIQGPGGVTASGSNT